MAEQFFIQSIQDMLKSDVDWDTAVFRALLVRDTSTATINRGTMQFLDDLTGASGWVEVSASGYSRQTLSGIAITQDSGTPRVEIDFADFNFGSIASGQGCEAMVVYVQVGGDDTTPANDPLVGYFDTNFVQTFNGNQFNVTVGADGLFQGA